jgi:hypothetical protein
MIFVTLAIGRRWSAFRSHRTRSESRSARIAEPAATFGSRVDGVGVSSAVGYGDGDPSGGTGVGGGTSCAAAGAAAAHRNDARRMARTARIALERIPAARWLSR